MKLSQCRCQSYSHKRALFSQGQCPRLNTFGAEELLVIISHAWGSTFDSKKNVLSSVNALCYSVADLGSVEGGGGAPGVWWAFIQLRGLFKVFGKNMERAPAAPPWIRHCLCAVLCCAVKISKTF